MVNHLGFITGSTEPRHALDLLKKGCFQKYGYPKMDGEKWMVKTYIFEKGLLAILGIYIYMVYQIVVTSMPPEKDALFHEEASGHCS